MKQLISRTPVTFTSFSFLIWDRDGSWEYTCHRKPTGQWTLIRRRMDDAPIPPFMSILCEDGEFHAVIGNEGKPMSFATGEDAVKYIEENP